MSNGIILIVQFLCCQTNCFPIFILQFTGRARDMPGDGAGVGAKIMIKSGAGAKIK